jgi:regulator of replication initiation timing
MSNVSEEKITELKEQLQALQTDLLTLMSERTPLSAARKTAREALSHSSTNDAKEAAEETKRELKEKDEEIAECNVEIDLLKTTLKSLAKVSAGSSTDKDIYSLPKDCPMFKPGATDIHNWFELLEAALLTQGTVPKVWYRLLGKTTQNAELIWVKHNILDLSPSPDWSNAKDIFATEFTSQSHAFDCRESLYELRQGKRTGAAFLREVESLAGGAEMNLDDPFFLHLMVHKRLNQKLREAIGVKMGRELTKLDFEGLKEAVTALDGLFGSGQSKDNPEPNTNPNKNGGNGRGKGGSETPNKTKCGKCGRTGHTTEACRSGSRDSRRNRDKPTNTDKGSNRDKDTSSAHITCFKCGEKGHYANTCPKAAKPGSSIDEGAIRRKLRALRDGQAQQREEGASDIEITSDRIAQALYDMHEEGGPEK